GDVLLGLRDKAKVIGAPVGRDEEIGIESRLLRFQDDHRSRLLALTVTGGGDIPPNRIANLWFAGDLLAGLQFNHANAKRGANDNWQTGAVDIKDSAVRPGCRRVLPAPPCLAHSDSFHCR